jgi:hypothetical protein
VFIQRIGKIDNNSRHQTWIPEIEFVYLHCNKK